MKYFSFILLKQIQKANIKVKMGLNSSKQNREQLEREQIIREQEALRRFNIRIKSYSYPHHYCSYFEYIEWCRAQYELDCIPDSCKRGINAY